ncbi:MAG: response regulator [Bacteroidales bacterium]|nr:response regulator [Bacteroidales bacterium]MBN2751019.1 response regulator [Bacteroidales bacterium]
MTSGSTYNWNDKTILIVEDDPSSIMLLDIILSTTNATLLFAGTGADALRYIKDNQSINIVLMDIRLPDINGIEITKQIKAVRPNITIIAQTACAFVDDMERCLNAGCTGFFTKPITASELLETINCFFEPEVKKCVQTKSILL